MLNMVKIANQLDQGIRQIFRDECVFRIVVDINFQQQNQFKHL